MLADKFVPWTEQWEQQGFERGLEEGARKAYESLRRVLLNTLEGRFGPLSEDVRQKVEKIGSVEELAELTAQVRSAASLDSLGLK